MMKNVTFTSSNQSFYPMLFLIKLLLTSPIKAMFIFLLASQALRQANAVELSMNNRRRLFNPPTTKPIAAPTAPPTNIPTQDPTASPTTELTKWPTSQPSIEPTFKPTNTPTLENRAPILISALSEKHLKLGEKIVIDVSNLFQDPENDAVTVFMQEANVNSKNIYFFNQTTKTLTFRPKTTGTSHFVFFATDSHGARSPFIDGYIIASKPHAKQHATNLRLQ